MVRSRVRDVRVLFFGDSLVAGVGDETGLGWVGRSVAAAHAAGIALTPYNLGVRRDTSRDILSRWENEARPRLAVEATMRVVFSFGANDTTIEGGRLRVRPEETATNLDAVLVRAAALDLPAFVVGPSPVNDARQRGRVIDLARRMNDVSTGRGIPFVDVAASIDAHGVWRAESERGDGAHPGAGGYAYLAELVADPWLSWLRHPLDR